MIKEWATVISWNEGEALLKCDVKTSCSGCASRAGCGTRVLNKLGPQTEHLLTVVSEKPLMTGQKVELGIAEKSLLTSAIIVYMFPLAGLFVFAGLFQWFFGTDIASMAGALLGGIGGFLMARIFSHRFSQRDNWQPVILSVALGPDALRVETSTSSLNKP